MLHGFLHLFLSVFGFFQKFGKIIRKFGFKGESFSGNGMDESDGFGMETLAFKGFENLLGGSVTVHRVTNDRMTDVGKMYPNLMGTSGFQFEP